MSFMESNWHSFPPILQAWQYCCDSSQLERREKPEEEEREREEKGEREEGEVD